MNQHKTKVDLPGCYKEHTKWPKVLYLNNKFININIIDDPLVKDYSKKLC